VAAILTNPGQADPKNVDKITLDEKAVAVPELIIVGGRDTVGGTVKPYNFYKRYHPQGARLGFIWCRTIFLTAASSMPSFLSSTGFNR
jgi:hypothetical protein